MPRTPLGLTDYEPLDALMGSNVEAWLQDTYDQAVRDAAPGGAQINVQLHGVSPANTPAANVTAMNTLVAAFNSGVLRGIIFFPGSYNTSTWNPVPYDFDALLDNFAKGPVAVEGDGIGSTLIRQTKPVSGNGTGILFRFFGDVETGPVPDPVPFSTVIVRDLEFHCTHPELGAADPLANDSMLQFRNANRIFVHHVRVQGIAGFCRFGMATGGDRWNSGHGTVHDVNGQYGDRGGNVMWYRKINDLCVTDVTIRGNATDVGVPIFFDPQTSVPAGGEPVRHTNVNIWADGKHGGLGDPIDRTASTTSGSPAVTGVGSITGITAGLWVYGPGIPDGAQVLSTSTASGGTVTMDRDASATASVTVCIAGGQPYGCLIDLGGGAVRNLWFLNTEWEANTIAAFAILRATGIADDDYDARYINVEGCYMGTRNPGRAFLINYNNNPAGLGSLGPVYAGNCRMSALNKQAVLIKGTGNIRYTGLVGNKFVDVKPSVTKNALVTLGGTAGTDNVYETRVTGNWFNGVDEAETGADYPIEIVGASIGDYTISGNEARLVGVRPGGPAAGHRDFVNHVTGYTVQSQRRIVKDNVHDQAPPNLAAVAGVLYIPDTGDVFTMSSSGTITSIGGAVDRFGRRVTLIFTHATPGAISDTHVGSITPTTSDALTLVSTGVGWYAAGSYANP